MSEFGRGGREASGRARLVGTSAALFERAPLPIAAVRGTEDPRIEVVNRAYEAQFGETSFDDVGETRFDDNQSPHAATLTEIESDLVRAVQEGRTERDSVERSTPRGRRRFAVEAIPADRGDLTAFLQYRDITTEEIREQQLAVLRRILRHDLRNDLAVLLGYAETIVERTDDPETRDRAAAMVDAASDLRSIATASGRLGCVTAAAESTPIGDAITEARRMVAAELSTGSRSTARFRPRPSTGA